MDARRGRAGAAAGGRRATFGGGGVKSLTMRTDPKESGDERDLDEVCVCVCVCVIRRWCGDDAGNTTRKTRCHSTRCDCSC